MMNKSFLASCYAVCKKHGYVKARNNLYRCYGDGLLQVISPPTKSRSISASDDRNQVHFGVYSLYSELSWIPPGLLPIALQFDLLAPFEVTPTLVSANEFEEYADAAQIIQRIVIPYLDGLVTHAQLANLLEQYDVVYGAKIVKNDVYKIVPYVLSEQRKKAIESITAIEEQNWKAYWQNCQEVPGYDKEKHWHSITERLVPLIELRNALNSKNDAAISEYLLTNYRNNLERLRSMGIKTNTAPIFPCTTLQQEDA